MPRLRNAVTVVVTGLALTVLGAGTASATTAHCPTPPPADVGDCAGGLNVHGLLDLGGLLDGVLGGLLGG
ncbi:MAG TPA: hypothetical protein DGT23_03980 [Micromonosporaceae bacterium]|nr:hypothetical protein [Micromonosporaceae bacterium]